jgi:altronate hydrolase
MDTPGFDPVSATGQVAGDANVVCFTTGRGSVFGCKPSRSIKIATNTPMYRRMEEDMDVSCGTIVDGEETVQQAGRRIFDLILRVASASVQKVSNTISVPHSSHRGRSVLLFNHGD